MRFKDVIRFVGFLALGTLASVNGLRAQTIIKVTGPFGGGAAVEATVDPNDVLRYQALAASWSQTGSYSNVSISVDLSAGGVITASTAAYLMTHLGPGTSVLDEIARTTFPAPAPGPPQLVKVFEGLTLGPGTYYLVLAPTQATFLTPGVQWSTTGASTVTTDTGVSRNADAFFQFVRLGVGLPTYAPNGDFKSLDAAGGFHLLYEVSTLAPPTNVKATQFGTSGKELLLTWDYGDDPIDGFQIDSCIQSASGCKTSSDWVSLSASTSPDARRYNDDTVPPFSAVSYRIRAYHGSDTSPDSDTATAFQIKLRSDNCGTGGGPCTPPLPWPQGRGRDSEILADFQPAPTDPTLKLSKVAVNFGYDHFNWISSVMYLPPSVTEWCAG